MFFSPLAQTFLLLCEDIVHKPELYNVESAREDLINSLEGFNSAMITKREQGNVHDMYKIGGTAFDDGQELEVIDPPYLPPLTPSEQEKTYTLVLDLDETLAHYFEMGNDARFLLRPGVQKFLEEMNKYYEIVIFTAAIQDYADWAIAQLDPNGCIKYRLYRQHALP
jgi:TFIIF-interacting CTD phosphatase-like protein